MNDLETRLTDLGDHLAVDETDTIDVVLARLQSSPPRTMATWMRVAAAVVAIATVAVVATPTARQAVAGWLGFGAVTIQRLPDGALDRADTAFELAGPGDSSIEVVDGREVLVSRFDARLTIPLLTKSVGVSTSVTVVDVGGRPGIWIGDGPHEVFYETDLGVGVERSAGRTLLWQADDIIVRLEGFEDLGTALQFAATLDVAPLDD